MQLPILLSYIRQLSTHGHTQTHTHQDSLPNTHTFTYWWHMYRMWIDLNRIESKRRRANDINDIRARWQIGRLQDWQNVPQKAKVLPSREREREAERGDKWRRVDSKPSESKYATNNGIMQL